MFKISGSSPGKSDSITIAHHLAQGVITWVGSVEHERPYPFDKRVIM